MDDIHLDDPRKFSAKQKKRAVERAKKNRTFWQYLFDLFIKALILAAVISLDFTLFANAGNYILFTSNLRLNPEAEYIYAAIGALSFIIMFVVSFFRKLENVILSLAFAITGIALVNQFATFEKHSGLLIFLGSFLSDTANAMLYEYSFWLIGAGIFVIMWILLGSVKRQIMFYFALVLLALLGWLLSESYLNSSVQYFKTVASSPVLRSESAGKNLVFLSFNNLTSPNNIRSMYKNSKQQAVIQNSLNNVLGFYTYNNFTMYPNALVKNANDPFFNLIEAYNPDSEQNASSHILSSAVRNDYFNFNALQTDRLYLKDSSLYEMLRKGNYTINVFQTRDVDTCYLDNKLAAASCKEKVNSPIPLNNGSFSLIEKIVLLTSQWLNSTGFVSSVNPLLQAVEMVYSHPALKTMNFEINNLYAMNAFKALDQIVESIDNHNGNQAYFAIIDLPSETYIYDEFCQLKPMSQWVSEKNSSLTRVSTESKRIAYAEQVSCLYGYLEKFMQQLHKGGLLENTTIIIEGLNNPLGLNKIEQDFYRQLQSQKQVMLAIRPADATVPSVDYNVCQVTDILNSFFFTHKPCTELKDIKTTDKNMKQIREQINQDKYAVNILTAAKENFQKWFMAWTAQNQFQGSFALSTAKNDENTPKALAKPAVAEAVVKDMPEQKMKSISVAAQEAAEQAVQENAAEKTAPATKASKPKPQEVSDEGQDVIPPAINDVSEKIEQERKEAEDAIARAKKAVQQKAEKKAEAETARQELNNLAKDTKIILKDDAIRNILEAPVAEGQKLSPEELKKQYHQNLKNTQPKAEEHISIKVNLVEN